MTGGASLTNASEKTARNALIGGGKYSQRLYITLTTRLEGQKYCLARIDASAAR